MLGPGLMILAAIAVLPASPPMSAVLIVSAILITPISLSMDRNVKSSTANLEAAGIEPDLGNKAQSGCTFFIGLAALACIAALFAVAWLGVNP